MNKDLEKRFYAFEIRAQEEDTTGVLSGRPVVYNSWTNIGPFDEMIAPGALDDTDLTDVRFLVNHNFDMIPLARSRRNNGNSTMKLSVDSDGLSLDFVKLDVDNNADARALYSAVGRGDMDGMSFCFSIEDDEWEGLESEHPKRTIKKIGSIVEISAVTLPAYADTHIEIDARSREVLDRARQAVDTARQEARASAVDTAQMLALEKARFDFVKNL